MSMAHDRIRISAQRALFEPLSTDDLGEDVSTWLAKQAKDSGLNFLLAHADDGVIWGRFDPNGLKTSHAAAAAHARAAARCPALRRSTLQETRAFGDQTELFLWRTEDGAFKARLIRDLNQGENQKRIWDEAYDEAVILIGQHSEALSEHFTLLSDPSQGLYHAVPIAKPQDAKEPTPRLVFRHYLAREDLARIVASRLVRLDWE